MNVEAYDYEGKEEVIVYDYVDFHIQVFDNMYSKRLRTYKRTGFQLISNRILTKQTVNSLYDSGNYMDVFDYVMSFWDKWLKYSILVDSGLSQKLST